MMGDGTTASPLVMENDSLRVLITPTSALAEMKAEEEDEEEEYEEESE